eukprot:77904-Rhodomonas_salina.1
MLASAGVKMRVDTRTKIRVVMAMRVGNGGGTCVGSVMQIRGGTVTQIRQDTGAKIRVGRGLEIRVGSE